MPSAPTHPPTHPTIHPHPLTTPMQLKHAVDYLVVPQDEALRGAATALAARLRAAGKSVDLVLEPKKLKWAFRQAERVGAGAWACSLPGRLCGSGGWRACRGGMPARRLRLPSRRLPSALRRSALTERPPACLLPTPQRAWCWWRPTSGPRAACGSRTWQAARRRMCRWISWCERRRQLAPAARPCLLPHLHCT